MPRQDLLYATFEWLLPRCAPPGPRRESDFAEIVGLPEKPFYKLFLKYGIDISSNYARTIHEGDQRIDSAFCRLRREFKAGRVRFLLLPLEVAGELHHQALSLYQSPIPSIFRC